MLYDKEQSPSFFPKLSLLPVLIATQLVAAVWYVTEQQTKKIYVQSSRDEVRSLVDEVRANLELHLNSDLYLAQGLAAALSIEPDMDQARFTSLAAEVFSESKNLRNVAAAPNLVISLIYPILGNETILGIDYKKLPNQRDAIFKARDSGELVLAGPISLVQGERAFIGRYPIFDKSQRDNPFWGILAAVIDLDRLYSESGLYNPYSAISVALENPNRADIENHMFLVILRLSRTNLFKWKFAYRRGPG